MDASWSCTTALVTFPNPSEAKWQGVTSAWCNAHGTFLLVLITCRNEWSPIELKAIQTHKGKARQSCGLWLIYPPTKQSPAPAWEWFYIDYLKVLLCHLAAGGPANNKLRWVFELPVKAAVNQPGSHSNLWDGSPSRLLDRHRYWSSACWCKA